MPEPLDPTVLPLISHALSQTSWMPRMPAALKPAFRAEGDRARRVNNRRVLVLLTVLFDLFWLPQRHAAPDIAAASAFLRLAVLTPGTVLFCLLDRRGRLGRLYEAALLALAVAPSVITAYLCLATKEMLSQPEIYGTPLILLYTGVLLRLRLGAVVANTAICTLVYAYSIAICPMLPHDEVGTVIFIQLVIDAAMIMFNLQLETRDRRVFLLTQNERIRRSLVAEQNRGLLRETQTDSLTRLANRRCFDQTLSARWLEAAETHEAIALIMIDVDHFKTFNDTYGHAAGDECLRQVAARMAASLRTPDFIARYGGEEFAAILVAQDAEEAETVAERLRDGVEQLGLPHQGAGAGALVTVSLGVATAWPATAHGARELLEAADRNLYEAKRNGRNRVSTGARAGLPHPATLA